MASSGTIPVALPAPPMARQPMAKLDETFPPMLREPDVASGKSFQMISLMTLITSSNSNFCSFFLSKNQGKFFLTLQRISRLLAPASGRGREDICPPAPT